MEFAAVNSPKSTAKTVAITLTNEEAKNPANAFAALLNLGGANFSVEHGLGKAEGQWMRAAQQSQRERDTEQKPKADLDAKPKEKISKADKPANDDKDEDVAAAGTSAKKTDDASANDNATTAAVGETQPTEQVTAVDLEAMQAISIQFQILVEMPNGTLQDMGTFDLKALLAAASEDASLASALESAFGQAADSLAAGQSLLSDLAANISDDPALAADLQAATADTGLETDDNAKIAELFTQIAAAFRPLAQQATAATTAAASTQAATNAAAAETAKANTDLQSAEAAEQSAELSRLFGDDNKIRIQVAVNGRKVADMPFERSAFNRYSGYNPAAMRTVSTANGQVGQGMATNAIAATADAVDATAPQAPQAPSSPQTPVAAAVAAPGFQTAPGAAQNASAAGQPRADVAQARAPEAAAPTASNTNSSTAQTPSSTFATALNQATGTSPTTQTAAPERPAPVQPQQVIEQIKVNITRAAKAGLDRVTIHLRPEELGRIEIKLEMTSEGSVRANVTADNPATLELLQREARGLERALQDAGLRAEANDLEFNLRSEDHNRTAENGAERGKAGRDTQNGAELGQAEPEADDMYDYALAADLRGGIDTYV